MPDNILRRFKRSLMRDLLNTVFYSRITQVALSSGSDAAGNFTPIIPNNVSISNAPVHSLIVSPDDRRELIIEAKKNYLIDNFFNANRFKS